MTKKKIKTNRRTHAQLHSAEHEAARLQLVYTYIRGTVAKHSKETENTDNCIGAVRNTNKRQILTSKVAKPLVVILPGKTLHGATATVAAAPSAATTAQVDRQVRNPSGSQFRLPAVTGPFVHLTLSEQKKKTRRGERADHCDTNDRKIFDYASTEDERPTMNLSRYLLLWKISLV